MDPVRSDGRAHPPATLGPPSRTDVVTLVFTDVEGSTALKQHLGDQAGTDLLRRHHQLLRETLACFADATEIGVAGDSFFLAFPRPSAAVRFALRLHAAMGVFNREAPVKVQDRIGIHLGEVLSEHVEGRRGAADFHGMHVDLCSRVMSLARGGQILLTRPVFDNARQVLKGEALEGIGELCWLSHGLYELKGLDEPIEVCEVAEAAQGPPVPPPSTDKGRRLVDAQGAPVPGWRPAIGQVVPNTAWVLERQLGTGGFGEVWLGRHRTLKELRVFKFCFRADRARALKREVTLIRLLRERIGEHPHIVSLREVFFDEPPYYLEMEYVEGSDFHVWCGQPAGGGAPLEARLEVVAQMADALQAAHDSGVIHRDVKPSNILVSAPRAEAAPAAPVHARLSDFGIGQVVSQEYLAGVTQTGFTRTILAEAASSGSGTHLYMAPELLAGRAASTRSDIYSLGVVLYQAAVNDFGRPLTTDWAEDVADPLLREDIRHCVAGKPEERFAGAAQLARSLRALPQRRVELERRQTEARDRLRLRQEAERRRRWLQLAAGTAFVLLVITAALGYGLNAAHRARQVAVAERERQRRLTYAADINLAQQALAADNLGRARQLLDSHRPGPGETDLRGWEWRYLWKQCQSDATQTLCQQSHSICSLAASADGRWLAVGEVTGGGLTVWELANRRRIATFPTEGATAPAAFSPEAPVLAYVTPSAEGGTNGALCVRLWNVETRQPVLELPLSRPCNELVFSPDGRTLVAGLIGSGPDAITLWDLPTGRRRAAFPASQAQSWPGTRFAVSRDLRRAACAGSRLQVLDLATGAEVWSVPPTDASFVSVAFSPDGALLASTAGYTEPLIRLWDAATGEPRGTLEGHRAFVLGLAFWPDGKTLASASADQTIRLWEVATGRSLATLRGHRLEVWRLALLGDQTTLVSGCKDGTVCFWNVAGLRAERKPCLTITDVLLEWWFGPGDSSVLVRDAQGRIVRHHGPNLEAKEPLFEFDQAPYGLTCVSDDGRWLAAGSTNGSVRVWELPRKQLAREFPASPGAVAAIAIRPDASSLVTFHAADEAFHDWDLNTARHRGVWRPPVDFDFGHMGGARLAAPPAIAARSRWWLLLDNRGRVLLRDARRGAVTLATPDLAQATAFAFAPDGARFAGVSQLGNGRVWETETRRELASLEGFLLGVHSVAFSPDGTRLALGSNGREAVKIWETKGFQQLLTLNGEGSLFSNTKFSPDGHHLGSLARRPGFHGVLHLWEAPSWAEIDAVENREAAGGAVGK
ncbi:MAG: protein kinase [Verrucomicrobiales bacterium]|nr:protein kinase [Verrucomicrobiales bacterium]